MAVAGMSLKKNGCTHLLTTRLSIGTWRSFCLICIHITRSTHHTPDHRGHNHTISNRTLIITCLCAQDEYRKREGDLGKDKRSLKLSIKEQVRTAV